MKGKETRTCFACGGTMALTTSSVIFHCKGKEIEIKGIEMYTCQNCGESIYSEQEAELIESITTALSYIDEPQIDVLNLDETAQYLRVSNQTVYNMIRDGRVKAYKVGREWRFLRADILAYMNSSTNQEYLAMAAKGGRISSKDLNVIKAALEEE